MTATEPGGRLSMIFLTTVVFPEPVSPTIMITWLSRISWSSYYLYLKIGSDYLIICIGDFRASAFFSCFFCFFFYFLSFLIFLFFFFIWVWSAFSIFYCHPVFCLLSRFLFFCLELSYSLTPTSLYCLSSSLFSSDFLVLFESTLHPVLTTLLPVHI